MAEQQSRSARGVRKRAGAAGERTRRGAGKVVDEAGSRAGDTAKGVADAPGEAVDEVQGGEGRRSDLDADHRQTGTVREELSSIVREAAMEVLRPIMRNATRSAAKYAAKRAPEVAMETVLPKLRDLGSNIEEAGGAGAFARETLSSASGGGGLSKLGQLGRGDGKGQKGSERVPEQESIDVAVPVDRAYEQFTQLDDFAQLLSGGEVIEEQESERIVWTSGDESATAVVTFHRLDDRLTRVMVSYDKEAQNFASKALSALQSRKRALRSDLARFKTLAEISELQRDGESDGAERSGEHGDVSPRRRSSSRASSRASSSRAQEPDDDDYDEEEPHEGEVVTEPEAQADEEPDAELEDADEVEGEPEEEEPARRPARRRQTRRRAPARPSAGRTRRT